MLGKYTGFYKYNNERVNQILSRDQTFFEINILFEEGEYFAGELKDEPIGQPGTGVLNGTLKGDAISFIKHMPTSFSFKADGHIRETKSKHPKIYYEGTFINGKFKGTWKIKFGFIIQGFLPILVVP